MPRLEHIIVVVMENRSYDEVRLLPYVASLIASGSSFSRSYAVTHPSQPNYLALWAGDTFGVTTDDCPLGPFRYENLGHACEAAGLTWRAYSEDVPRAGSPACSAKHSMYTRKHEPWTDFANLNHANERPYGDLAQDLAAGSLPALAFVVPNNCHNSHDCSARIGDSWLSANVPAMLKGVGRRGLVIITWDEDDNGAGNHILTVFAGGPVEAGRASSRRITHYTLLRTICDGLGLAPMGRAAADSAIADVWRRPPSPVPEAAR